MTDSLARQLGYELLEPYEISPDCPHLSEDQRELSTLTFVERAQWMAEWLLMAASTTEEDGDEAMG